MASLTANHQLLRVDENGRETTCNKNVFGAARPKPANAVTNKCCDLLFLRLSNSTENQSSFVITSGERVDAKKIVCL